MVLTFKLKKALRWPFQLIVKFVLNVQKVSVPIIGLFSITSINICIKPSGNALYVIGILLQQPIWSHMKIVYMGHRIINAASVATTLSLKNTS